MKSIFKKEYAWWLGLLLVYCAASFVPLRDNMPQTNGDEPHYLLMAYSLWNDGDAQLANNYAEIDFAPWHSAYPTEHDTGELRTFRLDAHMVSVHDVLVPLHTIGLSVIILPAFVIGGFLGVRVLLACLVTWALIQLYAACCAVASRRTALIITTLAGLTVPMAAYSHAIFPETVAFVAVSRLVRNMIDSRRWSKRFLIENMLWLSLLPWLHVKFALLSVTIFTIIVVRLRRTHHIRELLHLSIIPIIALLLYVASYPFLFDVSLFDYITSRTQSGGVFGIHNTVKGIPGLFLDREVGLLMFAPFYIYGLYGMWALWRKGEIARSFVIVALLHIVLHSMFFEWHGAFAPPTRFLVPIIPVLVMGVCCAYEMLNRRVMFWSLSTISVIIGIIGMLFPILLLQLGYGHAILWKLGKLTGVNLNPWLPGIWRQENAIPVVLLTGIYIALFLLVLRPLLRHKRSGRPMDAQ